VSDHFFFLIKYIHVAFNIIYMHAVCVRKVVSIESLICSACLYHNIVFISITYKVIRIPAIGLCYRVSLEIGSYFSLETIGIVKDDICICLNKFLSSRHILNKMHFDLKIKVIIIYFIVHIYYTRVNLLNDFVKFQYAVNQSVGRLICIYKRCVHN